jgi:hypothetical protein
MTFENCFSILNLFHLPEFFSEIIINDDDLNNNFNDFIPINYLFFKYFAILYKYIN